MNRLGGVSFAALALLAAILLGPLGARPAFAQEPPEGISISVAFTPPTVTIGDRVTLTVRVRHPDDVLITIDRPTLPESDVIATTHAEAIESPDGVERFVVTSAEFVYQIFSPSTVTTGPIVIRWLLEDGASGTIQAPVTSLMVVPIRPANDTTLRDVKPPVTVEGAPAAWIRPTTFAAAIIPAAAALAAAGWWVRTRRKNAGSINNPWAPEEQARGILDALRGAALADDAAFQGYYGTISATVRGYLGDRFEFNASALTTTELRGRMPGHGIDRWQARLVRGLLERCDRAVYARRYPDPASADDDLTMAFEIVELSRPRPTLVDSEREEEEAVSA